MLKLPDWIIFMFLFFINIFFICSGGQSLIVEICIWKEKKTGGTD